MANETFMKTSKLILSIFVCIIAVFTVAWCGERKAYQTLINSSTGLNIKPDDFESAEKCGECHPDQFSEWIGSMHANAYTDSLYRAMWVEASRELGQELDQLCAGCHTPVGTATKQVWIRDSGKIVIHDLAKEGVTCDFCHTIEWVEVMQGSNSFGNAGLAVDPHGPKRSANISSGGVFHDVADSPLQGRSELCASCHNLFHPTTGAAIARTYEEWKDSVYAEKDIQCQDCHMVPVMVAAEVASSLTKPNLTGPTSIMDTKKAPYYKHIFIGANTAMPSLLGLMGGAENATKLLQIAASISISTKKTTSAGSIVPINVDVKNLRAGHNLPTSMTNIRETWIHFRVKDEGGDGKIIFESGWLDKNKAVDPAARSFGVITLDENGNRTHKPWKVTSIEMDTTIPPREKAETTYTVNIPETAVGPLLVEAELLYRSIPQEMADKYLGKKGYSAPVITMTSDSMTIQLEK